MYFATFLALTIPLSAPALKDRPGQTPPLVGRWDCTSLVSDGQPSPQAKGLEYEFTVDGQWLIYRSGHGRRSENRAQKRPAANDCADDESGGNPLKNIRGLLGQLRWSLLAGQANPQAEVAEYLKRSRKIGGLRAFNPFSCDGQRLSAFEGGL